jgi:hypothetical protein
MRHIAIIWKGLYLVVANSDIWCIQGFKNKWRGSNFALQYYRNGHLRTPHLSWNDERRGQVTGQLLKCVLNSLGRQQLLDPEAIWASSRASGGMRSYLSWRQYSSSCPKVLSYKVFLEALTRGLTRLQDCRNAGIQDYINTGAEMVRS